MVTVKVKHECDYCGGWESDQKQELKVALENVPEIQTCIFLNINWFETKRQVCIKCAVKVLDTILGEPKK